MCQKNVSIDEGLINYKEEKRKGEKLCSLYKSETTLFEHPTFAMNVAWSYVKCRTMLGKIPYKKDIMNECIYFSYFYP